MRHKHCLEEMALAPCVHKPRCPIQARLCQAGLIRLADVPCMLQFGRQYLPSDLVPSNVIATLVSAGERLLS